MSGLLYCSLCGGKMGAAPRPWSCANRQQVGTFKGVSVSSAPMEEYVEDRILARMADLMAAQYERNEF